MKKRILQLCLLAGCFTLPSYAATFTISDGDVSGLISAINIANSNGQADIINLAANGTYILNAINFTSLSPGTTGFAGQRGLPEILNDLAGFNHQWQWCNYSKEYFWTTIWFNFYVGTNCF